MDRRRTTGVLAVAASAASLAVPGTASAMRDATATIAAPTRCDAAPGTRLVVRFRVTVADPDGTTRPAPALFRVVGDPCR